mgnify:CR=1 FL=1
MIIRLIAIAALAIALPSTVLAHHGTNGQFDASKLLTVTGVISDLAFVNPHAYVYIDVTTESGDVETWNCELRASSVLRRSGWTPEMFALGTSVHIEGVASRRDPLGCYTETISFNGGPTVARYEQIEEGQFDSEPTRAAVTAWGDPNIDGDWAATQRLVGAISGPTAAGGAGGPPRGPGGRRGVELTDAGEAYRAENVDPEDTVAGRLDCQPRDFFSDWTFDQPANRIIQEEDKIVLKYGFMDTERTIHMGMSSHPADIDPTWAGHSIGHWEDGVLVVDTIGFTNFSGSRGTHSELFHAVERFSLNTSGELLGLVRSYIGDDPLFWVDQQTGEDTVYPSDYPWESYACDDRST